MAKKKAASPTKKTAATESEGHIAAVVLKSSPEYRQWLLGISRDSLIPVASIVRDALAKWAESRGHSPPPRGVERRPARPTPRVYGGPAMITRADRGRVTVPRPRPPGRGCVRPRPR